jgi:hypothetical protein
VSDDEGGGDAVAASQAAAFLHETFQHADEGVLLGWSKAGSLWWRPDELEIAAAALVEHGAARDIWVGCGLRAQPAANGSRGGDRDVVGIPGGWSDIDTSPEEALPVLERLECPPSLIVGSGHHVQAWWLFDELWTFDGDEERVEARTLLRRLHALLRAEGLRVDAVHDLARVLRVPGTLNHKSPPPRPVTLLQQGRRYSFGELDEWLPPGEPAPLPNDCTIARPPEGYEDASHAADLLVARYAAGDERFAKTWAREREFGSASEYDLAVCVKAADMGADDATCWALVRRWRQLHGEDPAKAERADYASATLAKARAGEPPTTVEAERGAGAEQEEPAPGDGVFIVRASDVVLEDVEYFDDKLIPLRVVTLVVGIDGVGKSTLLYTKAASATRGELPGAFYGTPCDIVVASSEDHAGTVIVPRLLAADADLARVHIVKCRRYGAEGEIALPDDLPAVDGAVGEVGARGLIVDPLIAHMPLHVDTHKAQHVRQVLAPLARIAETRRLAVAAVVHFNGAPTADVRSRISGSKALRDAARSVLVCGADPADESRFVVVQDKNSFGPKAKTGMAYRIVTRYVERFGKAHETSGIEWLGEVPMNARALLAGPENPEERDDIDRAKEFLEALVPPGERVEPREAQKAAQNVAGVDTKTLQRARRKLKWRAESEGFTPKRWWWVRPSVVDTPLSGAPPVQYEETLTAQRNPAPETHVVDTHSDVSTTERLSTTEEEL